MSLVHLATELSGGAGSFVKHLHFAMQGAGQPSFVITREQGGLADAGVVKPITRVSGSLRAHKLNLLGKLGVIDTSYAVFGIEKNPVDLDDIRRALGTRQPTAFIFYWISYFVGFETILQLRRAYPQVPLLLLCTDEALLTGGCHYSHGCAGYQARCHGCPALALKSHQRKLEAAFLKRRELVESIDPLVVYPTTNIYEMGANSSAMKGARFQILPLGAISLAEVRQVLDEAGRQRAGRKPSTTMLVRASTEFRKGSDLFASALGIMAARMPDLASRLRVISIGDDALVRAGIDRYVEHVPMGYIDRQALLSAYAQADVFVVSSREDGGPLMTNECSALGIHVISTPIGVARDLIDEGSGTITRDISAEALGDAMTAFLMKRERGDVQRQMAQRKRGLTFEGYIENLMELIEVERRRLIARNRRAASSSSG